MYNQNLFRALQNVCNFIALESDMAEIRTAVEKDMLYERDQYAKREEISDCIHKPYYCYKTGGMRCRKCKKLFD